MTAKSFSNVIYVNHISILDYVLLDAYLSVLWVVTLGLKLNELEELRPLVEWQVMFSHHSHDLSDCLPYRLPVDTTSNISKHSYVMEQPLNFGVEVLSGGWGGKAFF